MRVLGIEGWGDLGYVAAAFAAKTLSHGGVYQHASWKAWQAYANQPWDIVLGHSLGGDAAVRICKMMKVKPKALILMGARYQTDVKPASLFDWFLPYDPAQVFTAPAGVPTYNFWTFVPLPSAPCNGAILNRNVSLTAWHGSIPYCAAVQKCFDSLTGGHAA